MKGLGSHIPKTLTLGSRLLCHDNSGAKLVEIIGVSGYRGVRGRNPHAGVGDTIIAAVKKGKPDMVKKKVKAVIVRQKKEIRRPSGLRVSFEDNACVLVNDEKLPIGTEIKGVVAKEIAERFPKVAAIAPGVV
ncbi:50S ribosomal protein L14 [Candidatus Micrarchaeota archaeon]|nr:50S ribosomal protein L14 [Candidatus Micrarchaeota archaeon]MBD3418278.1 50S ribosomal protein L14 [Candidatus Micrarchaeota archaeon]